MKSYLWAVIATFVVDVSSKWVVSAHGHDYTYNIAYYRENWGITVASAICAAIFMTYLMTLPKAKLARIPAGLCVGGSAGNIASMLFGPRGVMDFIVVDGRWYANVADFAQAIGVVWVLVLLIGAGIIRINRFCK